MSAGFDITNREGFHITFENGCTVSVQFGYGNYCDNRDRGDFGSEVEHSANAEVAAWDANGDWFPVGEGGDVIGYQSPAEVLAIINRVAEAARAKQKEPAQ